MDTQKLIDLAVDLQVANQELVDAYSEHRKAEALKAIVMERITAANDIRHSAIQALIDVCQ